MSVMRLLSANLMSGGADPGALADLLRREQPDAAAFQEISPEQARAIEKTGLFPHGSLDSRSDSYGLGLVLRHPAAIRRLPLPLRDAWIAQMRLPTAGRAEALEIICVHVTAPHQMPPWEMLRQRRAQVRGLRAHIASVLSRKAVAQSGEPSADLARRADAGMVDPFRGGPTKPGPPMAVEMGDEFPTQDTSGGRRSVVLLGDLNSNSLFPAYRSLTRALGGDPARVDAALIASSRNGHPAAATWSPRPGWPRLLRIDHALVDPSVHVQSLRVVDLPGSDHAALLLDILVPPPAAR